MSPAKTSVCTLLVALWGVAGAAGASGGSPRFLAPKQYELPGFARSVAVGELNRDGRSDVVVGGLSRDDRTALLLSGRRGRFSAPRLLEFGYPAGYSIPGGVALADFNGDGNRDIVRAFLDGSRLNDRDPMALVVLFGDGRGRFPTRTVRRAECCGTDVVVGDFNGDGDKDVAVPGTGVFLGNGSGRFPVIRRGIPQQSDLTGETVAAADLNRDRDVDLVVLTSSEIPESAYVLLGAGDGRFDEFGFELTAAGHVASVAIGRFNADRWPDLATVSNSAGGEGNLRILLGTRSGRPRLAGGYRVGEHVNEVEVADVNGDGKSDLVVMGLVHSSGTTGTVWAMLGNGTGSFRGPIRLGRCCNGGLVEVGHFNRDGRLDIAATSYRMVSPGDAVPRLSILINDTPR